MVWNYDSNKWNEGAIANLLNTYEEGKFLSGVKEDMGDRFIINDDLTTCSDDFLSNDSMTTVTIEGEQTELRGIDAESYFLGLFDEQVGAILGIDTVVALSLDLAHIGFMDMFNLSVADGDNIKPHEEIAVHFWYILQHRILKKATYSEYISRLDDAYMAGGLPMGWSGHYPQGRMVVYSCRV